MKNVFQLSRLAGYATILCGLFFTTVHVINVIGLPINSRLWIGFSMINAVLNIILTYFWATLCHQCKKGAPLFIPALILTIGGIFSVIPDLLFPLITHENSHIILSSINSILDILQTICTLVGMIWLSRLFAKGSLIKLITIIIPFITIILEIGQYLISHLLISHLTKDIESIRVYYGYFGIFSCILGTALWATFYLLFSSINKKRS
jgi:hypothetical protein